MIEDLVQLVAAAKDGDRRAFGRLVERFRGRIYAQARAIAGDREEALELTQETFVRALQGLPRLERPERFHPWLRGITLTLSRDLRRKAARERRHAEAAALERPRSEGPADAAVAEAEAGGRARARLAAELDLLPEATRTALDLRFREGLAYAEIAEVMGVPPSTVRGLLARGTKALRARLQAELGGGGAA